MTKEQRAFFSNNHKMTGSPPSQRRHFYYRRYCLLLFLGLFVVAYVTVCLLVYSLGCCTSTLHHEGGQQHNSLSSFLHTPIRKGDRQHQNRRQQRLAFQRDQQQQHQQVVAAVDGTFNNVPLTLRTAAPAGSNNPISSTIHCVGDNFRDNAWQQRSCHFTFLCFNMSTKDYVVFQSKNQEQEMKYHATYHHMHMSTVLGGEEEKHNNKTTALQRQPQQRLLSVSIGGINLRWGLQHLHRLEWFPQVVTIDKPFSYYELPPHIVMVPFHSMSGSNPGHLIWDDFLPIYTLLDMFGYIHNDNNDNDDDDNYDYDILPMRHVLHDGQSPFWASCDDKLEDCQKMMTKFLPLLVGYDYPYRVSSTQDFDFQPKTSAGAEQTSHSDLICARHGVAGIGSLTDHGVTKMHGWEKQDYETTHNHGRGGILYRFRNFCLDNLGLLHRNHQSSLSSFQQRQQQQQQHLIVFSQNSSHQGKRNTDFVEQIEWISKSVPQAQVQGYIFSKLTLVEQLEIVIKTSIFVTYSGGGAVVAMLLPRGASVILFYAKMPQRQKKKGATTTTNATTMTKSTRTGDEEPDYAYLDWDLFNSLSHLRVHWLHRSLIQNRQTLTRIILHEIQWMESS